MGRIIDEDDVLKVLCRELCHPGARCPDGYCEEMREKLKDVPTAQPKIGKWVEDVAYYDEDGCPCIITRCNQCGEPNPVSNFCPSCGAKMEETD